MFGKIFKLGKLELSNIEILDNEHSEDDILKIAASLENTSKTD